MASGQVRDALIEQLKLHEGWKRRAYLDSVGKITAGCGRNLTDKGLSDDEILYLLNNDLDECVADLATFAWFHTLDPVRQRVMLDLRFNLGPTKFRQFKRTLRMVEEGNYEAAAKAMRASVWYGQVRSRGVRLVRWMQTGVADE